VSHVIVIVVIVIRFIIVIILFYFFLPFPSFYTFSPPFLPPTNLKFVIAAPYQSAKIWAVDFQEKSLKLLPPDVKFKG